MENDIKEMRKAARNLIKEKKFTEARLLIDRAIELAPSDIKCLEVLDFWFNTTDTVDEAKKLHGQLDAINQMLKLHPSGTTDVFEEADYFPDLHEVRVGIMGALALETLDLLILKDTMAAYDRLFEMKGNDEDLIEDRNSIFHLVSSRIKISDVEKVFGDPKILKEKFEDGEMMGEV